MSRRFARRGRACAALGAALLWGAADLRAAGVMKERDSPAPSVQEIERPRDRSPGPGPKPPGGAQPAHAPEGEDDGAGRVIVPLLVYTPEMHLGFGGLLVQFFRLGGAPKESRVSSVAFVVLVTTRRQAIFEILPDFYWDDEKNHVSGKLEYQRFPDSFFGIGAYTREKDEERYERERLRFRGGPQRRFFGAVYAGLYTDLMSLRGTYTDANGLFATTDVPGEEGGFTTGVGPTVSLDTRDNAVSSRKGTLIGSTWLWFNGALGSRYDFWKLFTEARQFFPVGTESALGVRYYGEFQRGDVPYYHLAMLGGDELLRGHFMGRYRDKHLLALEAEYRFPLFWKFGAVVFAGAGEVADTFRQLADVPIRPAGGGGLRLSLNSKERLNLRLDVGVGPGTFGVYFTAREAF